MHIRHRQNDGTPRYTNALIHETSPYLRQHAHNPVDWHAWNAATLAKARELGRPIHLSIGYSACHWCHVLADESFEDEKVAQRLNELFVNVKVDREERPDLDRIYQLAQQLLTQRPGGWPLTMFLTPDDQRPFFGGTYFPPVPRHGLPAFGDLIVRVASYYREHQDELRQQNSALIAALEDLNPAPATTDALDDAPIRACRAHLETSFDANFGGFSAAPKFPHANQIERLFRDWFATVSRTEPDLHALYMATLTLQRMATGGFRDQVGFGFYRYSVDPYWMIPHFEKMLYDNALLLPVYANAVLATGDSQYAEVARTTAEWVIRELGAPEGGFYSSLDADSAGHEGRFYVWDKAEVRALLTAEEYEVFAPRFGLDRGPNFEGQWHLHTFDSGDPDASAEDLAARETLLESARRKLLAARESRLRPMRDEKILTSWNALMIRGLAIASRALDAPELAGRAGVALDFLRRTLWKDGRLLATFADGRAHLAAYLDDYAYLLDAVLELQQCRFRSDELDFARELANVLLAHFEDRKGGGFWFTADDHEALIHRSRTFSDDATPSGNGVASTALQRLGWILGEERYLRAAERTVRAAWHAMQRYPHAHTQLLATLEDLLDPPDILIVRGSDAEVREWCRELSFRYAPRRYVLGIPAETEGLPAALADKRAHEVTVGYRCRGQTCDAPRHSLEELVPF